jgi:amino acid transporter
MDLCGPESGIFLHGARRFLLVLHAGGSIVLIGAATHHALQMRHYLRGRFGAERLEKTYAKVVSAAYLVTYAIGALLYPSYRVHVRGYYLDRHAPAYAGLFDVKETYASLTLVVAIALGALAFTLRPAETPALVRVYAVMSFIVCAVVWLNVIAGLLVVSVRGVG